MTSAGVKEAIARRDGYEDGVKRKDVLRAATGDDDGMSDERHDSRDSSDTTTRWRRRRGVGSAPTAYGRHEEGDMKRATSGRVVTVGGAASPATEGTGVTSAT